MSACISIATDWWRRRSILNGDASIESSIAPADANSAYVDKYTEGIQGIGMTPDSFAHGLFGAGPGQPTYLRGH